MASSHLKVLLECSICRAVYTDPVSLKCGHSFCWDCIHCWLDTQEGSGSYSCPECRDEFLRRPSLRRNVTLHNVVESVMSAEPGEEDTGVSCIHTPVPAVRSCLHCEASLSDDHRRVQSSRPRPQPTSTLQRSYHPAGGPNVGAVQQPQRLSVFADILLDVGTAGNRLQISEDLKTITSLDENLDRLETPERFQSPQVLSSQTFSSGRHYWDVDVEESGYWRIGMCYPSIGRRGDQSEVGYNRKSWCLKGKWVSEYSVMHNGYKIPVPVPLDDSIYKIRIDLDYEAGRISFYDLCDPIRHLHTFTTTFTEPLHAALYILEGSTKICGGNQM
ncbi:RING finger protein 39-like [Rana temporaria]|uniref:RING finger protein 39-like n=1 Tax=Rana temporaria TaxID=8407 RepID=UPI001AAC9A3A|nr:RING finger protein 39-like [Rana temporaria]